MRYFKFALAAGASIVVAARLTPAYALPPVYPLDPNGPIRQGDMCITPASIWENTDTGYGYTRFYECGPHKRAHRETHGMAHDHTWIAPSAPPPHHLDINGPIRQGRWCIAPRPDIWANTDTGYGYGYFYECAPVWMVGGHHHHHVHHARHHQGHHRYHQHHQGHHRHALHLGSPEAQELCEMILPHTGGSEAYAIEHDQQSWQTIADADGIEVIDYGTFGDDGINLANANVTDGGGSDVIIGNDGNDRRQDNVELPVQIVEADQRPVVSLEWIRLAAGEQVSHSLMRRESGERIVKIPFGSDQRHAPVDPVLAPLSALGQRSPQLQLRREDSDAGQLALTRGDYSSSVQSDAGGGMSVTTKQNGYSPIAAVLGLALALGAPIALLAMQVPVVDKAAIIDTVSDPIAEIDWHIPIENKLTVGQRTTSISPLASLVAPIKSAAPAAMF